MKFSVVNLGCKVNRVESDNIAAAFLAQGHTFAENDDADMVVVNTCTVTEEAERKTRKAVRHALAANPRATVIVSGCASALHPDEYEALDKRICVVSRLELESRISDFAQRALILRTGEPFNTRVNVKVQDGCDNDCSYCIVHVARGPARSVAFSQVVREVDTFARAGVREIVLTGINLGTYFDEGKDLAALLETLLELTVNLPDADHPVRFRIGSIEPQNIDDRLIDVIAQGQGRICRHLHLPLQSGSSAVLEQMRRHYRAQDFLNLVDNMYTRIPQLSLSTDIIVGFPGETDEQFQETLEVARRCRFSKIHVFPYSKRAGTQAAVRSDQIDAETKRNRARILRNLATELREADFTARIGTTEAVLVEPSCALTESYHEIARPENADVGELIDVVLERTHENGDK